MEVLGVACKYYYVKEGGGLRKKKGWGADLGVNTGGIRRPPPMTVGWGVLGINGMIRVQIVGLD